MIQNNYHSRPDNEERRAREEIRRAQEEDYNADRVAQRDS